MLALFANKVLYFRATEFECYCCFVKEYNIEIESVIGPMLYSARPVRLQMFCTLAIIILINVFYLLYPSSVITYVHKTKSLKLRGHYK